MQTFPAKGQIGNILSSLCHVLVLSILTTQICDFGVKEATGMSGCVHIECYQ
jgi:hypothetical protein